jgi:hypothetical protein
VSWSYQARAIRGWLSRLYRRRSLYSIVVVENLSLDGVMQAPGRADEDIRGGFDRGGWANSYFTADPEAAQAAMAGQSGTTAMLFGHRTYLDLVDHWLSTPAPNPFACVPRTIRLGSVTATVLVWAKPMRGRLGQGLRCSCAGPTWSRNGPSG